MEDVVELSTLEVMYTTLPRGSPRARMLEDSSGSAIESFSGELSGRA